MSDSRSKALNSKARRHEENWVLGRKVFCHCRATIHRPVTASGYATSPMAYPSTNSWRAMIRGEISGTDHVFHLMSEISPGNGKTWSVLVCPRFSNQAEETRMAHFKVVTTAGPVPGADYSLEMEALAA